MNEYLELFLSYIVVKGSQKTAKEYRKSIEKFLTKCDKSEAEITYIDLLKYYNEDIGDVKINSKRVYMSAILSYFKFLYEQNLISADITKSFKLPKAEVRDMPYLEANEALKVSNVCLKEKQNPYRKNAMFITFVNTGMRASELANVKLCDIDKDWLNVCNAKGNKFRRIPLHPSVIKAIDDYIKHERRSHSEYLFVNRNGNKLSDKNINADIHRVIKLANINKDISAHRLRDTFATIQYINGADIKSIQETMGHENIQMTLHYVQKVDKTRKQQIIGAGVSF